MNLGSRRVRLKTVWLLVIPFLILARPSPRLLAIGAGITVVGVFIRGWAAGLIKKDRELTVSGPYAYTRNPLYLGSLFIGLGVTIAGGRWFFIAIFLAYFLVVYGRTMRNEEEILTEQFGEPYRRYRDRVPSFLPRPTPFRPREMPVSPAGPSPTEPSPARSVPAESPPAETSHAEPSVTELSTATSDRSKRTWSFSLDRYLRNKEWEAALGALAGFATLTAKLFWAG